MSDPRCLVPRGSRGQQGTERATLLQARASQGAWPQLAFCLSVSPCRAVDASSGLVRALPPLGCPWLPLTTCSQDGTSLGRGRQGTDHRTLHLLAAPWPHLPPSPVTHLLRANLPNPQCHGQPSLRLATPQACSHLLTSALCSLPQVHPPESTPPDLSLGTVPIRLAARSGVLTPVSSLM